MSSQETRTEEYQIDGDMLLAKVKELVHEGNVRRVVVKNEEGVTLLEIPLTVGVIGAALLPIWAAIGAIAAFVAKFTIVVEKVEEAEAV